MTALRLALAAASAASLAAATLVTPADAQRRRPGVDEQQQQQQQQQDSRAPQAQKQFPTRSTWVAVSLNGRPFPGERPTFSLDEQFRARGFGGCRTYSATAWPLPKQVLAVGPLALTNRTCDKATMDRELQFLTALRHAGAWDLVAGQLVIKTQAGELRFERTL
ncbi:MAG TPA: META domain-containing protein [Beijerinckiaceae bacterium]|nr:META domain-containing protein [Beijerinckiaceae bacterium]